MRSKGYHFHMAYQSVFEGLKKDTPLDVLEANIAENKALEAPEKELLLSLLQDHKEYDALQKTITKLLTSLATFQENSDASIKTVLEPICSPLILELSALLSALNADSSQHKPLMKKFETSLIKAQDIIKARIPSNTIVDSHFFHSRLNNIDPLAEKLTKLDNLLREALGDPPEISTAFTIQK